MIAGLRKVSSNLIAWASESSDPLPYAGGRERDGGGEDQGTCV